MKKKLCTALAVLLIFIMAMPTYAMDFIPSPEMGDIEIIDYDVEDSDGKIVPERDDIILKLTLYKNREGVTSEEIRTLLENTKIVLDRITNISELTPEIRQAFLDYQAASTDDFVKNLSIDDFMVNDLFNLSLVKNGVELVPISEYGGVKLHVRLKTRVRPDDVIFILADNNGAWSMIQNYKLDENGILELTLEDLCNIVIVKESKGRGKEEGKDSPKTGQADPTAYIVSGILVAATVAIIGTCLIVDKKKFDK